MILSFIALTLVACGSGATIGSSPTPVTGSSSSPVTGGGTPSPTPSPTVAPTAMPTASAGPTAMATTLPAGEKIYVVNHGNLGDSPSVTIYPVAASGAATPIATISGANTQLNQPFFDVVDSSGTLYVSNQGNPGTQTAGYVTEYAATDQSGNVAPTRTITGLFNPQGVALDSAGNLYVAVVDAIDVFAPGASGPATPIRVIGGSSTTLQNLVLGGQPAGVALDSTGDEYVAMGPAVLEFAPGATGNVAPTNVFGGTTPGSDPATTGPPYGSATLASCLGVAVSAGELYCANFNNSSFAVFVSAAAPGVTVESTGADMPFGIWIDTAGEVFVANYKNSSVQVFSSTTTFLTGLATATISGTGTNLNYPYGVTAR
jgi:serine/threonine-protein kinase